ncbi:MAG: hypothetical protein ACO3E1_05525, partial [Flavobacteriales bacterium]
MLLASFFSQAQNYKTFNSARTSIFECIDCDVVVSDTLLRSIHIDSVKFVGADSVYFPSKSITNIGNCISHKKTSWIGESIVVKNNGDEIYTIANNYKLTIKPYAAIHDTWTSLIKNSGNYITAEVMSINLNSFLGVNDSVKVISLKEYNSNNVFQHVYDLKVSKNHGALELVNLYELGQNDYNSIHFFKLKGLSNPNLGLHNLTWKEIHNYEVGDEFHTLSTNKSYDNVSYINEAKRVLEKTIIGDTILYKMET